jgi:hypothetical protein
MSRIDQAKFSCSDFSGSFNSIPIRSGLCRFVSKSNLLLVLHDKTHRSPKVTRKLIYSSRALRYKEQNLKQLMYHKDISIFSVERK